MSKFIYLREGTVINIDSISCIMYDPTAFKCWNAQGIEPSILTIYINNSSLPFVSYDHTDMKIIDNFFSQIESYIGYDFDPTDTALMRLCNLHRSSMEQST